MQEEMIISLGASIVFTGFVLTGLVFKFGGMFPWKRYLIYRRVRHSVGSILPKNWVIKRIGFITMERVGKNRYEVFVEIHRKGNHYAWECRRILVNGKGKILKEDLSEGIKLCEEHIRLIGGSWEVSI